MQRRMLWAALGLSMLVGAAATAQTQAVQGPSLYKRLGGYDAIAAVTDDFVPRLVNDKVVGRFLVGLSDKHLVATLDKFKVPEKEKSELLAAVSALKPDIVEKP